MGVLMRGFKNTFRNGIRTGSIIFILSLSMGLALVMFLSLQAINNKIDTVKSSIGNTITVSPAGARGFEGGGEPLTDSDIAKVRQQAHVVQVDESLNDRLSTGTDTNLSSAIDPGTLGRRFGRRSFGGGADQAPPANFSLPITVIGTNNPSSGLAVNGNQPKITAGSAFATNSNDNVAVVGQALATKNNLSVGSTFQAYNTDIKVVGVYDAGNTFSNSSLVMPLQTIQRLSQQSGDVTSAVVRVDSISNLQSVTDAIKSQLGNKADVVSAQDTSAQAVQPLENIRTVSMYSLVGALGAGAIILFLSMLMVARERRREIGVLKAIGASNISVVSQMVVESITLTLLGGALGVVFAVILSNPIMQALTNSATNSSGQVPGQGAGQGFGRMVVRQFGQELNTRNILETLQVHIGYEVLLYGLLAVVIIAIVGSAVPAWLTAKVRPAEVMRGE